MHALFYLYPVNTLDLKDAPPDDIGSQLQVRMLLFHLFNPGDRQGSLQS